MRFSPGREAACICGPFRPAAWVLLNFSHEPGWRGAVSPWAASGEIDEARCAYVEHVARVAVMVAIRVIKARRNRRRIVRQSHLAGVLSNRGDGSFSTSHRPRSEDTFPIAMPQHAPIYRVDQGSPFVVWRRRRKPTLIQNCFNSYCKFR